MSICVSLWVFAAVCGFGGVCALAADPQPEGALPAAANPVYSKRELLNVTYYVEIMRSKKPEERIQGLTWQGNQVQVETSGAGLNTLIFTRPIGKVADRNYGILYKGLKVKLASDGRFRIRIPVNGPYSVFTLTSVSPEGTVQEEKFVLRFPRWAEFKGDFVKKKFNLSAALGFTFQRYEEIDDFVTDGTENITINEMAVSVRVSAFYLLVPGVLDLGLNTYINALPFGSTEPGYSFRVWGINARVGWVLPFVDRPWRFSLMGGMYYFKMLSSAPGERVFGIGTQMGPQIYPLINYYLPSGVVLTGYFKYSPVGNGFALTSLANRELAGGVGMAIPVNKGANVLTIGVDYSQLDLDVTEIDADLNVHPMHYHQKSVTLNLGYGF
jgi:hypothetical protein